MSVDPRLVEVEPAALKVVSAKVARKYLVLPLALHDKTLVLATTDPTNIVALDDIRFMTGCTVDPIVAEESALRDAIDRHYGPSTSSRSLKDHLHGPALTPDDLASVGLSEVDLDALSESEPRSETAKGDERVIDLTDLRQPADAAPVVKLANVILIDSFKRGASDVHVEPYEKEFRVRFRIDGILYNVMGLPLVLRDPLVSRLKAMARLKLAEKQLPQHGRFRIKLKLEDRSRELDFRVSSLPTPWGEKLVLHLLDPSALVLDFTQLGFEPHALQQLLRAISKPRGAVLVSGPSGSGRTTTLYSAIRRLNRPDTNILTAEDSIEYHLPGVNQVQVRADIGLTLPALLREFAAHDANIIFASEIQDSEAATTAFTLALDGRLVLASMRGEDDAPSTLSDLRSMGVAPFLAARAVSLVVAQRLVRRLCDSCKAELTDVTADALHEIGFPAHPAGTFKLFRAAGCDTCHRTGYRGRAGLFEVLEVTEPIRDLIAAGASSVDIKRKALEEGMLTLRLSGLEKIKAGVTSIDEVVRETTL